MDLNALFNDPVTWTGLGLVIFVAAVFIMMKPHKTIAKSLDERAAKIELQRRIMAVKAAHHLPHPGDESRNHGRVLPLSCTHRV